MRRLNPYLTAAAVAALALPRPAAACTTGVVSGKATADGRPLLWKNRDISTRDNQVQYFPARDGRHAFLAVTNAGDRSSVWMGVNEKGFCIENSVVKDLPRGDKPGLGNGEFMRHALATCGSVAEFEALLLETNLTGRKTQANFGVIDAHGGAAIFESGHVSFVKFDANDPAVAPLGYVVRSNFTMTGTGNDKLKDGGDLADVYSGGRYLRADALFRPAAGAKTLDHRYLLRHCARDLADERGCPLPGSVNGGAGPLPPAVDTASTLSRRTTVSAAVFHGVKPGEDPLLTTMWVMLGEPAVAVAVPCWVRAGEPAPARAGGKLSPLCTAAVAVRTALYDEAGQKLRTARLPTVWAATLPAEDANLRDADRLLAEWRASPPARAAVAAAHRAAAARALAAVTKVREAVAEPAAVGAAGGGGK